MNRDLITIFSYQNDDDILYGYRFSTGMIHSGFNSAVECAEHFATLQKEFEILNNR
jgi:hypothetical protein